MSAITLHGVDVRYIADTTTPVTVSDTTVIGLVGTAPNAGSALAATATLGSGKSAIKFIAATSGAAGNAICVQLVGGKPNQRFAISISGKKITIKLATDNDGVPTSTLEDINVAAIFFPAHLIKTEIVPGSDYRGKMRETAPTNLAGGRDEFPFDTPVLINNSAVAASLGTTGTLPAAIADVWRTSGRNGALIVAVRTAQESTAAATLAKVIGDKTARTGIYALLNASKTRKIPTLLAAPGNSDNFTVAMALQSVADDLGAIAIVDGAGKTATDAITHASRLGKAYIVWPKIQVYDASAAQSVDRPPSGLIAGHIARVDGDEGWHNSPSNRPISNVIGAATPVDFDISNPNSTANILNREFIATLVRRGNSTYLWGNRLANGRLISHQRVERIIGRAVGDYAADWVHRKVDVPFIEFVLGRINNFLRNQTLQGILTSGKATFDPAKNTATSLAANQITFSIALELANIAEHLIIEQRVTDVYNKQIIAEAAQRNTA